jgi:DNA-binding NarL/FixJ family response regulator
MNIFIVDDHPMLAEAIEIAVLSISADVTVKKFNDLVSLVKADLPAPDLVLLDLGLPGYSDIESLAQLKEIYPSVATVIISGTNEPSLIVRAIEAGAAGFVPKTSPRPLLISALKVVLAGGIYIPRTLPINSSASRRTESSEKWPVEMTLRQQEVFSGLIRGLPTKAISRDLSISETTVKNHITAIFQILGVHSRTQAVIKMSELGFKPLPSFISART